MTPLRTLKLTLILLLMPAFPYANEGAPVGVAETRMSPIYNQVNLTGTITSPRVSSLSVSTSGLIADMRAQEGDKIEAGGLLLQLDAELAQLNLAAANADASQAQRALDDANRRLREAQKLAPQRSIAETVVRGLEAEVALDTAALDRARADAAYQQGILDRHQLRAPFTGVISRKLAELGEWVQPGQGVFELVATDGLRLDFAVAEDYLGSLTRESLVRFSLNALPDRQFEGRITTIVPVTEPGARTFLLRVEPKTVDQALMPGLSVVATINIPGTERGLTVPRDATIRYPDGRTVVWTVESSENGNIARENVVRLGNSFNDQVEVRSGLQLGDRVVVQGNESLQNSQRVRIVGADN